MYFDSNVELKLIKIKKKFFISIFYINNIYCNDKEIDGNYNIIFNSFYKFHILDVVISNND